jgi:zinc transport system substrate-binding protein
MRIDRRIAAGLIAVTGFLVGCSPADAEGGRTVVASLYPLAFAAERIAGPGWEVIDLTPPGTEAHDVELSLQDRAAIEDADVVVYLGPVDFQPQIEQAVEETDARVVAVWDAGPSDDGSATIDPHAWLDPVLFAGMVDRIGDALDRPVAAGRLRAELDELDRRYRDGLANCEADTMVVSHEAFGYLARRYGLDQVGLAGLEPEGEPTAAALREAAAVLAEADAGAVFSEAGEEARRIAETVAADAGVAALPLSTLESRPPSGDYLTAMEANLGSLREGLRCA